MAEKVTLELRERTATGKQVAKLRRDGVVPAVVYGSEFKPQNVELAQNAARKVVRDAGRHTPVQLTIGKETHMALIKSIDYEPARSDISHISFQAVRADEVVTTEVPIVLSGVDESSAARAGLIVLPVIEHVEVRAKTADLPSELTIDAMGLAEAEQRLTLADVTLPSGVEIVDFDPDQVVATVWEPAALEAKNAAADKAADEERAAEAASGETAEENVPAENADEKTEEAK
jgi:large subunit ribosomal protein L25